MDGRKIANLRQEGYRMPKPQHVDKKLYVNIVFSVFSRWLLSYCSICSALCSSWMWALRFNRLYLLNQPNEGKWKKKYTITSWSLLCKSFVRYYKKMEFFSRGQALNYASRQTAGSLQSVQKCLFYNYARERPEICNVGLLDNYTQKSHQRTI